MNTLTGLVLALCVALVACETCTVDGDCFATTCSTGDLSCVQIGTQHLCTCIHLNSLGQSCSSVSDCSSFDCTSFGLAANTPRHCFDNHCRCEGQGHTHNHGHQAGTGHHHHQN